MIRAIRRNLRQWKNEFSAFWRKFNTFKRIAFGIFLAMVIILASRWMFLDTLSLGVGELSDELAEVGAPTQIPDPDTDDSVVESELMANSIEREIKDAGAMIEELQKQHGSLERRRAVDSLLMLDDKIGAHGLRFDRRSMDEDDGEGSGSAPDRLFYEYEVKGSFGSVFGLLNQMSDLPSNVQIENPGISRSESPDEVIFRFEFSSIYVN